LKPDLYSLFDFKFQQQTRALERLRDNLSNVEM